MTLSRLGKNTSEAEVTNISLHGLWLLVRNTEYFLPYEGFPWFKDAKVSEILNVELLHGFHLRWPDLDVDLDLASLEAPDQSPMVYR